MAEMATYVLFMVHTDDDDNDDDDDDDDDNDDNDNDDDDNDDDDTLIFYSIDSPAIPPFRHSRHYFCCGLRRS